MFSQSYLSEIILLNIILYPFSWTDGKKPRTFTKGHRYFKKLPKLAFPSLFSFIALALWRASVEPHRSLACRKVYRKASYSARSRKRRFAWIFETFSRPSLTPAPYSSAQTFLKAIISHHIVIYFSIAFPRAPLSSSSLHALLSPAEHVIPSGNK